jgi:hypothetical protein
VMRPILLLNFLLWASFQTLASEHRLPTQSLIAGGVAVIDAGESSEPPIIRLQAPSSPNTPVMLIAQPGSQKGLTHWYGLIGVSLKKPPKSLNLIVNGTQQTLPIGHHQYKEQHLTVKKKHVNPSQSSLDRIRKEGAAMRQVFGSFTQVAHKPWRPMTWPAEGPISSPFGLQRFFNGERRNPHSGLDIAGPRGAPIIAPMAGVVVQTGNYYFNGNTVLIDHGQGLISMMCHMDSIDVEVGTYLDRGDLLGTIGATGRVTGPHLHWTLSLNNARVDPMLFLEPRK